MGSSSVKVASLGPCYHHSYSPAPTHIQIHIHIQRIADEISVCHNISTHPVPTKFEHHKSTYIISCFIVSCTPYRSLIKHNFVLHFLQHPNLVYSDNVGKEGQKFNLNRDKIDVDLLVEGWGLAGDG